MRRKLFFLGVTFSLLVVAGTTPVLVQAEGDPPPPPEPVKPPWITGINPIASLSTAEQVELTPTGIITSSPGVEVPLMVASPGFVALDPQVVPDPVPAINSLAVPQRYQDPADVTCGAAALGMALEFLSLSGEGEAPSQDSLINELKDTGLLYGNGTGVEELTYLARHYGYHGTSAFHDWNLDQLGEQLAGGRPVVVSLGANGGSQPGHFVTLTGISADGQWVSYNDPILGNQTVSADNFNKLWSLQGNSGLVVQKEALHPSIDPMLPWMGLFSAMAMLAVMTKQYPLGNEITKKMEDIRTILSNPHRKGLGGKLIAEGGSSSAPKGYKWVPTTVPKYGWKNVTITEKVVVPNLVKTWAIVKVNRWIEKVPVYKTVKVDKGHWAYRTVTKYRTERIRTKERYKTKKYYWYRRNERLRRGSYSVWKTRTVVKTRRVPYKKREKFWNPKIVAEKRLDYYRTVEHRDPIYGWRTEKKGTKIVEHTKTTRAWKPVGSEVKWKLEKIPTPIPTPTPTPKPPVTHEPERVATPELTGTPFPVVSIPMTDPNYLLPGLGVDAFKLIKKGHGIWDASKLSYNPLASGNYSVSAPGVAAGGKLIFRQKDQFIPGTYYTPGVLAKATGVSLLKKWNKGLGISLVSSVGLNIYDYSIGEQAEIGLKSNEFAASTAVDFLQAGLTGLAAAGAVALTIGLAGAAGATAVAAAPLWLAAGITALVGMGITAGVNYIWDMDKVKQKVADGFETFPGIIDNAKTIVTVGAERVGDAVNEAITSGVDSGRDAVETIVNTSQEIAHSVSESVQSATKTITDFVGSLFGGD